MSGALIEAPPGVSAELATEQLSRGYPFRFVAGGGSMWPLIPDGQSVVVHPCDHDEVVVGDVVLLSWEDKLVLHRVVVAAAERLLVRGDSRHRADGWFCRTRVLGRLHRRPWDRAAGRLMPVVGWPLFRIRGLMRRLF